MRRHRRPDSCQRQVGGAEGHKANPLELRATWPAFNETHCSGPKRLGKVREGERTRVTVQTRTCRRADVPFSEPRREHRPSGVCINQRQRPESVQEISAAFIKAGENKNEADTHKLCLGLAWRTHSLFFFFLSYTGLPGIKSSGPLTWDIVSKAFLPPRDTHKAGYA